MDYILTFDLAGLVLLLVLTLVYIHENRFPSRTNRIFYRVLVLSILSICFNIITAITNKFLPAEYLLINNLLAIIHISLSNIVPIMYFAFIISITHEQYHFRVKHHLMLFIPILYDFITIVTSPFTHFVMYYDSNYQYQHGIGMKILYLITIAYVILSVIEIVIHHKRITIFQKTCVLAYSFLVIFAAVFQSIYPQFLVIGFSVAVSCLIISFTLRNPLEFIDQKNGMYNTTAFKEYYFSRPDLQKKCTFGLIHITNYDNLQRIYGQKNAGYIMNQRWSFLKEELGIDYVFYITKNCYLILSKNKDMITSQLNYIHTFQKMNVKISHESELYEEILTKTDVYILEDFNINRIKTNGYISNPIDRLLNLLIFVTRNISAGENVKTINDTAFEMYEERHKIRTCINRSIADDAFEVFLQPIFNVHTKKFTAAESLLRLRDNEGNYISPALFIKEAEDTGRIFEVGDISLRKTCEFINQGRLRNLGIEKVNVNLSMNQCMHENIAEHLVSILDDYKIPYDMICFEITETIMSKNPDYLLQVIKTLNDKNISFAVDDYGTGYSNTSRMLSFPFSEIKFDKSLVDAASINRQNGECMKYMFAMVKSTQRLTLAEGVETKEVSDIMEEYGCDLIQGFYYSKPLPLPQFIDTVAKVNQRF